MCPVCIAAAALIAAGAPTTGGLTTLVVKKLRAKAGAMAGAQSSNPENLVKGEQQHQSSENCRAR
jgi:hypothetical protein